MSIKTATVTARVQPEIKQKAEAILEQLGVPVSVLIDSLYRQIIMTNSIPYAFQIPSLPTRDTMTQEAWDAMLAEGLAQAKEGKGLPLEEAFAKIQKSI